MLVGDGVEGFIYEVQNKIAPLKLKLTGLLGAVFPVLINVALWILIWLGLRAFLNGRNRLAYRYIQLPQAHVLGEMPRSYRQLALAEVM